MGVTPLGCRRWGGGGERGRERERERERDRELSRMKGEGPRIGNYCYEAVSPGSLENGFHAPLPHVSAVLAHQNRSIEYTSSNSAVSVKNEPPAPLPHVSVPAPPRSSHPWGPGPPDPPHPPQRPRGPTSRACRLQKHPRQSLPCRFLFFYFLLDGRPAKSAACNSFYN